MRIALLALILIVMACNNQANKKEDNKDTVTVNSPVKREEMPQPGDTLFNGFGNEPFWAVYVINNKKILFHPMEGADVEVPYVAASTIDSLTQKYASATDKHSIVLIITKKPCSDGMSDITHAYAIELMIDKTNYSGCGK